jgi:hypothetical protein
LNQLAGNAGNLSSYIGAPAYSYATALQNNPYTSGLESEATAGSEYALNSLIPQLQAGSNALTGAANQVLTTAFDPQQALYDRTSQQLTDQSNAINAQYGLSSSPYGAGVAGQTMSNFNIDWQAQQLQNQLSGLSGASNAIGSAAALTSSIPNTYASAGELPYAAYNTAQEVPMQGLDALAQLVTGSEVPTTEGISAAGSYLGQGTSASTSYNNALAQAYANQLANYQAQTQASQGLFGGLGSGIGTLFGIGSTGIPGSSIFGNLFGGGGGSAGGVSAAA